VYIYQGDMKQFVVEEPYLTLDGSEGIGHDTVSYMCSHRKKLVALSPTLLLLVKFRLLYFFL